MTWTVTYAPSAEAELAEIWLKSSGRDVVALAADAIDRLLATDPVSVGESRGQQSRILVRHPLAVEYRIREQDRVVTVVTVREWRRRGS
jgi:hypothetical protein